MDTLLEPISKESPTGEDLAYDPVYSDLAVAIEGTPENQFEKDSAKEPNWSQIRKMSEDALKRSKDLQMAVYFTVSQMQLNGIEGAARGIELIAGFTKQYWDNLFPSLDPDDKDPTQRVNIISQLTVEPGSFGDPIKFINRINAAAIFKVPGMAVSMDFVREDKGARLPEIVASADPEEFKKGVDALRRISNAVHAMDDFLIQTVGRGSAPSFDPLLKVLTKGLQPFDALMGTVGAAGEVAGTAAPGGAGVAGAVAPPPPRGISGEIGTPDDVRKALQKICDYYTKAEPSSPVPILCQRALRLVGKNFMDLIVDLTPAGKAALDVIVGPPEKK